METGRRYSYAKQKSDDERRRSEDLIAIARVQFNRAQNSRMLGEKSFLGLKDSVNKKSRTVQGQSI
jgi:hypothetical protein